MVKYDPTDKNASKVKEWVQEQLNLSERELEALGMTEHALMMASVARRQKAKKKRVVLDSELSSEIPDGDDDLPIKAPDVGSGGADVGNGADNEDSPQISVYRLVQLT
ncbi:hypothetical protein M427DRAFT_27519 [Gonapodya prolifera JEL478]|uniref:Uncharacterized protein n=1 Tax=Gonapodya prolifera (strain JEL478) TaxID=1344416 RepID=A0A139AWD9_GONPJ|nr:hypothetical protein M427DRAFT_27519 [Gonapodya prolifera JEL478]|eukprot:KXS21061.1 hypothetical protein M427DRAFT_27519 [Gonapodya prolifera JEL478]